MSSVPRGTETPSLASINRARRWVSSGPRRWLPTSTRRPVPSANSTISFAMRWSARCTPRASRRALRVPATTIAGGQANPSLHQSAMRNSQSTMEGVRPLEYNGCHYGTHANGPAPRLTESLAPRSGTRSPLRAARRLPVHARRERGRRQRSTRRGRALHRGAEPDPGTQAPGACVRQAYPAGPRPEPGPMPGAADRAGGARGQGGDLRLHRHGGVRVRGPHAGPLPQAAPRASQRRDLPPGVPAPYAGRPRPPWIPAAHHPAGEGCVQRAGEHRPTEKTRRGPSLLRAGAPPPGRHAPSPAAPRVRHPRCGPHRAHLPPRPFVRRAQLGLRAADALRHPGGGPGAPGPGRLRDAGLDQLRQLLVPLVHAPPGGAAGEYLVRGEVDVRVRTEDGRGWRAMEGDERRGTRRRPRLWPHMTVVLPLHVRRGPNG